ncbi:MAG TPA: hypothetical protein VM639_22515 [Dongiaceae bacterium]|nr:hypothetical protein [Dongiaceae bacterium]
MLDFDIGIKWFLFRRSGLVVFAAVFLTVAAFALIPSLRRLSDGEILSFVGAVLALIGFFLRSKFESEKLLMDLFYRFNCRFKEIFESFEARKADDAQSTFKERTATTKANEKLRSYLDICAEEYACYAMGRIDPRIWQTWCKGMVRFLDEHSLRLEAEHELGERGESYYELTLQRILRYAGG